MERTRVLLIGAGKFGRSWGKNVIPGCTQEAELVAVADRDEKCRDLFAGVVPVFSSVEEALAAIPVDLAVNVTQPEAHLAVNETLLRSGIPVLCEKPIAESMEDAITTANLLQKTGGFLMIAENYRYFPAFRVIRQLLQEGTWGRVHRLECHFRHDHPDYSQFYHGKLAHPLLSDVTVHHLDLARYLTGLEMERVFCTESPAPYSWYGQRPGSLNLIAEMQGGIVFSYDGTLASPLSTTDWNGHWEIECDEGVIGLRDGRLTARRKGEEAKIAEFDANADTRGLVLMEACRALQEHRRGETDFADNLKTFRWMTDAILSSEEGRWVNAGESRDLEIRKGTRQQRGKEQEYERAL